MEADQKWMSRALALAERGRGFVEPNPLVGAVCVRDGRVVGEGWHEHYGEAHAEVNALRTPGADVRGATLYVTLEPCCHHGKTPPCTDLLARAGLGRIVVAMVDPFPAVAGKGITFLREAGIEVEVGLLEAESRALNRPYLKLLATGRPYVHAKWAMTLDGKLATRTGDSKWISDEASRAYVHALRGRMDAIIIGIGTALRDDPLLTARPPGPRTAARVVLDSRGRLPTDSQLVRSAGQAQVIVAVGSALGRAPKLPGCETLVLPGERPSIACLLDELGRRRMTNVLVEGGSEVFGAFFDHQAVDEVHVFVAACIVGARGAKEVTAGHGVDRIADALRLIDVRSERVGDDVLLHGRTPWSIGE